MLNGDTNTAAIIQAKFSDDQMRQETCILQPRLQNDPMNGFGELHAKQRLRTLPSLDCSLGRARKFSKFHCVVLSSHFVGPKGDPIAKRIDTASFGICQAVTLVLFLSWLLFM